jgi:hypothetical protein
MEPRDAYKILVMKATTLMTERESRVDNIKMELKERLQG